MSYQLPTLYQIQELCDNCTWQWTTVNGVNGLKVTGPNGNSIFLPAAGYRYGTEVYYRGLEGFYWSGTLIEESYGGYSFYLFFLYAISTSYDDYRNYGNTVRPVTD